MFRTASLPVGPSAPCPSAVPWRDCGLYLPRRLRSLRTAPSGRGFRGVSIPVLDTAQKQFDYMARAMRAQGFVYRKYFHNGTGGGAPTCYCTHGALPSAYTTIGFPGYPPPLLPPLKGYRVHTINDTAKNTSDLLRKLAAYAEEVGLDPTSAREVGAR